MNYILAIFSSRNETLYFANMFKTSGFYARIVNTPKEAGQVCGISVRFYDKSLVLARQFLQNKPFRSFVGFYKVIQVGMRYKLEKIL